MSKQAKVLTAQEIRRVLDYVATRPHSVRNRAMFLTMLYAMLRVKECAALRYEDVLDAEGKIKAEFICPQNKQRDEKAEQYLSAKSYGKSYKPTFVSFHLRHSATSFSIHRNVQVRGGTAIHSANTSTICSETVAFLVVLVTARDALALRIWQTKASALGYFKASQGTLISQQPSAT
jgi:site-specific recombinase XerC